MVRRNDREKNLMMQNASTLLLITMYSTVARWVESEHKANLYIFHISLNKCRTSNSSHPQIVAAGIVN